MFKMNEIWRDREREYKNAFLKNATLNQILFKWNRQWNHMYR